MAFNTKLALKVKHIQITAINIILQELYKRQHLCKKSIKQNGIYLVCVKEIM